MTVLRKADNMSESPVVLLVGAGAVLWILSIVIGKVNLYLQRRRFKLENGCKPVKYRRLKDPIWGIDDIRVKLKAAKEQRFLELSRSIFQANANTYAFRSMGTPIIATIEPENIKTILSLRFKDFGIGNREKAFGPLLGRGIFTTDGEPWHNSRQMIRPNFARDQVADLGAFERHIQTLFKILPRDGSTVDLQELFFCFTIDSATEFLFGHSTNTLKAVGTDGVLGAQFAKAFNDAQHAIANRARLGLFGFLNNSKQVEENIKICHEFVDQFVDEAVRFREVLQEKGAAAKDDDKYVFLQQLAQATDDKKRLRDELLNVLLAGRDTTASLLSNMWFMLAKHPEVYAKLHREVEETLNGEIPTYDQLRNLKYLKYCMNESLRLHPVVPGNSRIAFKDSILPVGGGPDQKSPVFVPKGTVVAYSPYTMHRREDFYGTDSEDFRPERWESLRPGWEYLPFNGGPRICLGQQYALTEAGYVTVRLLQQFKRLESRDPGPWKENLTLTVCSWNGTKVGLIPA